MLENSDDRGRSLDAYIDELVYRREDAVSRLVDIQVQEDVLDDQLISLSGQIAGYQQTISAWYDGRDEMAILEAISQIESLRTQEADTSAQRVFLGRFRADYESLVANTDPYLETLRANWEALVSGVSVHITPSNTGILQQLNLLSYPTNE